MILNDKNTTKRIVLVGLLGLLGIPVIYTGLSHPKDTQSNSQSTQSSITEVSVATKTDAVFADTVKALPPMYYLSNIDFGYYTTSQDVFSLALLKTEDNTGISISDKDAVAKLKFTTQSDMTPQTLTEFMGKSIGLLGGASDSIKLTLVQPKSTDTTQTTTDSSKTNIDQKDSTVNPDTLTLCLINYTDKPLNYKDCWDKGYYYWEYHNNAGVLKALLGNDLYDTLEISDEIDWLIKRYGSPEYISYTGSTPDTLNNKELALEELKSYYDTPYDEKFPETIGYNLIFSAHNYYIDVHVVDRYDKVTHKSGYSLTNIRIRAKEEFEAYLGVSESDPETYPLTYETAKLFE